MRTVIATLEADLRKARATAEAAIAQVDDAQLTSAPAGSNSIAVIVRHLAGNFVSRFTDFLTSDGEKPWRDRDGEFEDPTITRDGLMTEWNRGWDVLMSSLASLTDADLSRTVTIRGQSLTVLEALVRSFGHASLHIGQIVFLAKALRGDAWKTLTIPRGQSKTFRPPS